MSSTIKFNSCRIYLFNLKGHASRFLRFKVVPTKNELVRLFLHDIARVVVFKINI